MLPAPLVRSCVCTTQLKDVIQPSLPLSSSSASGYEPILWGHRIGLPVIHIEPPVIVLPPDQDDDWGAARWLLVVSMIPAALLAALFPKCNAMSRVLQLGYRHNFCEVMLWVRYSVCEVGVKVKVMFRYRYLYSFCKVKCYGLGSTWVTVPDIADPWCATERAPQFVQCWDPFGSVKIPSYSPIS